MLSTQLEYTWPISCNEIFVGRSPPFCGSLETTSLHTHTAFCSESVFSPIDSSSILSYFSNILLSSATCVSLDPETPPTAFILDVPRGGSFPLVPLKPLPSATGVAGLTLKAPQVGLPSSMLFLNRRRFSKCGPNQQRPQRAASTHIAWKLVRNSHL